MTDVDRTGALRARDIRQRFGDRLVLDGVDLDVPAGRVIGLLGPNGAGKTTLMRIIFGVLQPDSGSVEWRGRPATTADRRSWGYMPQERGLYRDMRVGDHLVFLARLHGVDVEAAKRRCSEALLERLGLADRARSPVKELSGGMGQRVQLAAALVHEPELLVLDEPFAGLDPDGGRVPLEVVLEQVSAGRNLVLSSHQLDLVEDICESITLLHQGRVVLSGEVAQLKAASPHRYLRVDVAVEDAGWSGRPSPSIGGSRPAPVSGSSRAPTPVAVFDLIRCPGGRARLRCRRADALGAVPGRHRCIVGRARA